MEKARLSDRLGTATSVRAQAGIEHMSAPAAVDLQIALRDAFILETAPFQQIAGGGVFWQASGLDPR